MERGVVCWGGSGNSECFMRGLVWWRDLSSLDNREYGINCEVLGMVNPQSFGLIYGWGGFTWKGPRQIMGNTWGE
ncbi:hypothetical protein Lal_00023589 [Lupinus albus]|nr:hypothetical protein Lal_00023589 [Lupinus albus]